MSSGLIYTYVESKEALLHQVLVAGFGLSTDAHPVLPVRTPAPGATLEVARVGLRELAATPRLRAAVDDLDPADVVAELVEILEERYLMIERVWPALGVIERSAVEVPGLQELWGRNRRAHFDLMTQYLELRTERGYLRAAPDAAVTSRIISETIVWFSWHRHADLDSALYDDELARQCVVQFIVDALVQPASAPARGHPHA
jgi:hypothetical protein